MNSKLQMYIPLIDFLAEMLGSNTEVVLHDFTDVDNSIIKIRNEHVSGRKHGSPVTDFALKLIKQSECDQSSHYVNYASYALDGRILKSSTYLIRDDSGVTIGMICINIDCNSMTNIKEFVDDYFAFLNASDNQPVEKLSRTPEEVAGGSISSAIAELGIKPERMTVDEKKSVILKLYNDGVFLLKGSAADVAKALHVSIPTVYRYLKQIKEEEAL